MSLKTTALFPPPKNEQHKLKQANVVALFCFFFQLSSFHAELELHKLVMVAMLHGVTLAVALVSTEGLHASLAAFQEVYEAGKNGWSCMSVMGCRDGCPPPQKKKIYSESANKFRWTFWNWSSSWIYIFKYPIIFCSSFFTPTFFPLVETSLIVGSMELKKITKNMVVGGFLTTTFQQ